MLGHVCLCRVADKTVIIWLVLQREIAREQQRVRELEQSSERQKRFMRVKLDEMSMMQRRLRSVGLPLPNAQNMYVGRLALHSVTGY